MEHYYEPGRVLVLRGEGSRMSKLLPVGNQARIEKVPRQNFAQELLQYRYWFPRGLGDMQED